MANNTPSIKKNQDITKVDEKVVVKCLQSPIFFIDNFCKIEATGKGLVPFKTYYYQQKALEAYTSWRPIYILKSRQLGMTTLAAGYALWKSMFPWNNVLLLSKGEEYPQMIIRKIKIMYENLPPQLQSPLVQSNQTTLEFWNKNMIKSLPATDRAWAWFTAWLVIIDEFSWFPGAKAKMPGSEVWASIAPTLSTWWQIIVQSTPLGTWNKFYELYATKNSFWKMKFHWSHHPDFGKDKYERETPEDGWGKLSSPWADTQKQIWHTVDSWSQEFECQYLQSWRPVFRMQDLFITPLVADNDLAFDSMFVCGVDIATWWSLDYSTAQFVNVETGKQVELLRVKDPIHVFAKKVLDLCKKYNMCKMAFETNSWYWAAFLFHVRDYDNLYYQTKIDKVTEKRTRKVWWHTSSSSKEKMISDLNIALQSRKIKLTSETTINEMKVFQYDDNDKMNAAAWFNDDAIIALAIAWQVYLSVAGDEDDAYIWTSRRHNIGQRLSPVVDLQWRIEQEQWLLMPKVVKDWRR